MWVSLQLALPLFVLQVIASTAFALLLVMFRHTRLDFWGVVLLRADAVDLAACSTSSSASTCSRAC